MKRTNRTPRDARKFSSRVKWQLATMGRTVRQQVPGGDKEMRLDQVLWKPRRHPNEDYKVSSGHRAQRSKQEMCM